MRIRNVKNKEEILNNSKFLVKDYKSNITSWSKLFNNNNPIYIEIGMGKGKFIIENAKKYPNINFIGIERFDSILAKALPKIDNGINNLLIILRIYLKSIRWYYNWQIGRMNFPISYNYESTAILFLHITVISAVVLT